MVLRNRDSREKYTLHEINIRLNKCQLFKFNNTCEILFSHVYRIITENGENCENDFATRKVISGLLILVDTHSLNLWNIRLIMKRSLVVRKH